jgi:hypothetical protein
MHELGHNLGLHHGGNEATNRKPNHLSVMNYLYTYVGLPGNFSSMTASERARSSFYSLCDIESSPCSKSYIIDFSDGSSVDLDENNVSEALNIGRGSVDGAYADWNNSGRLDATPYPRRLTQSEPNEPLRILRDYDEWGNLSFPYSINGRTKSSKDIGLGH